MAKINIIRPPKINQNGKNKDFWKQIGMIIIGTTISLAFTILAAQLMEHFQRNKDRKLSAMMVLSNIEQFSRTLDENAEALAHTDSVATWLLSKPIEELELLTEDELNDLIDQATSTFFLTYDKSAENIFSNNIETWKNMGNVQFIDLVGQCFSAMHQIEEYWNNRMTDVNNNILEIKGHPDQYEGSTVPIKILKADNIRLNFSSIHYMKSWLSYTAATMRYHNRRNMNAIGISEEEVMAFTNKREHEPNKQEQAPNPSDYSTPPLNPDSLNTFSSLDAHIDSLAGR